MFLALPLIVYIFRSVISRFTRICSNVSDFNNRNKFLTAKLHVLKQCYQYHVGTKRLSSTLCYKHILSLVADCRHYFMFNLHKSTESGWDQTS